jgi:hypothetical protein
MNLINVLRQEKNWDRRFKICQLANKEIEWWSENSNLILSSPILQEESSLEIESDASLDAWGAVCQSVKTGGKWTTADKVRFPHINSLELYAAFLALQTFVKPEVEAVTLKLDNKTAVA